MKRKLQVISAALLLLVAIYAWRQSYINRLDPLMEGWRLSEWLFDMVSNARSPTTQAQGAQAVRATGADAIPLLLQCISAGDGSIYQELNDEAARYFPNQFLSSSWRVEMGVAGFEALGAAGQPAVPELLRMFENENLQMYAVRALGATRDPRAFKLFCELIAAPVPEKRRLGLSGLEAMKDDARGVTEQLLQISKQDKDYFVRAEAMLALGSIGEAKVAVPYLAYVLQNDTNEYVRYNAAVALGSFPQQADFTRPILTNAMQSQAYTIVNGARIGLQNLDDAEFVANLKGPANAVIRQSLTNGAGR